MLFKKKKENKFKIDAKKVLIVLAGLLIWKKRSKKC